MGKKGLEHYSDLVDDATVTIDLAHHKVHAEEYFTISDSDTIDSGAGARKVWQFTTPNSAKRFHFMVVFYSNLAGVLTFAENPTVNVAGTGLTVFNNDRNSIAVSTLTAKYDTTLTTEGTILTTIVIGTSSPKTQIGGNARLNAEWILKANEDYALAFTADNDSTIVSMVAEFYEV